MGFLKLGFLFIFVLANPLQAEDHAHDHAHGEETKGKDEHGHKHDEEKEHAHENEGATKEKHNHDHGDEKEKAHKDEHGHGHGDEHGHGEGESKFGPGKAILAVEEDGERFQLSAESIQFLNIQFAGVETLEDKKAKSILFKVPKASVAYFQAETALYKRKGEWIEEVPIEIIKKETASVLVRAKTLSPGDQIAVSGVNFLRTAQLEASGQGGEGHAH